MTQGVQTMETVTSTTAATDAPARRSRTVWGLTPRELHDAFWHARGVQCVRRGEPLPLQRAAELFLLIEPAQLVIFRLAELSERLTWHNAAVTRLRIVDQQRLPFEAGAPNAESVEAMNELIKAKGERFDSGKALFEDLGL